MAASLQAIELRQVTKRFGATLANDGVSLALAPGAICGLVGENGAGKTTAMKILCGELQPDSGTILLDGTPRCWRSPADAIAAGIGMVHQHFLLAGPLSVLDNIILGSEPGRWGWIERKAARNRLRELARQTGLHLDFDQPVERLPIGLQQRVEILKLLYRGPRVLILDEPTAVLTPQETDALFDNLRDLRDQGNAILLVTHKLKEVLALADTVTVMRAGKVTASLPTAETTAADLAERMVGRPVAKAAPAAAPTLGANPALELRQISLSPRRGAPPRLHDISFQVRHGELVGIAGVEGNGQSELLDVLFHAREWGARLHGQVRLLDSDVTAWPASRIRQLPIAFIPEDRERQGLLLQSPLTENFWLGHQDDPRLAWCGIRRQARAREELAAVLGQNDVRPADPLLLASQLSGGNQQKFIVGREFNRQPRLVIAAQPTRGVDIGAVESIHRRLLAARDAGAGVLLVSSDLDEIQTLADRILVLYAGRLAGEFRRGEATDRQLGLCMGGAGG